MIKNNYRQALIDKIEATVTQGEVIVGSGNTAYLSAGSGQAVICLHGGGAGTVTWYPSMGSLAKYFHVVAPDIVGFGESGKPDAANGSAYGFQ